MTIEQKLSVLESMTQIADEGGMAEGEEQLLSNFLPLRSYSKMADERVFLITGGRGAGKTELFRVLTSPDGFKHVVSELDRKRYTGSQQRRFIVGYITNINASSRSKDFPANEIFSSYAKEQKEERITCLWAGMLCYVLLREFAGEPGLIGLANESLGVELTEILIQPDSCKQPRLWIGRMEENVQGWELFFDRVDDYFEQQSLQIYVTYDELDRICPKYSDLFIYIRALLNFWYTHNNRWRYLKAKIFLRSDLYNSRALHFVDASKMRGLHMELKWDSPSLYRLLIKRLMNCGNLDVETYLADIPGLYEGQKKGVLGYIPGVSEDVSKWLMEKMVGKYMGSNPKKGLSYSWIPNHIQDANSEISPRSFLKCFLFAAQDMYDNSSEVAKLQGKYVLSPSRLQAAVTKVSVDRVKELTQEEYGWLENLVDRLRGQTMLMDKMEFMHYLEVQAWPEAERDELPGTTALEIFDVLKTLGIIQETWDGRINVPEIYLHGFGLKRRGGIRRPR